MVSTRGQRAKEESETALATQLSLAEQLLHELEAAVLFQQGDSRQDVSQQDVSQQDISLKDDSQEDVSQPIASQQDISAEVRVEPDGNEPASESIIVEHSDDKSLLSVKDVQGIIKAEAREGCSVKTENTDDKLSNDLAIRLKGATSSVFNTGEDRKPPSLSSLPISDTAGHTLISTSAEKKYSRVYSLRSRAGESGKIALTDVQESNATVDIVESRDASETDDATSANEKERFDGTNVKDDDDYHPPVSSRMRRQRKAGPSKTKKPTHHSQLVAIGPSSKNNGGYAFQQHHIIQDTLATDVAASQKPARARGRKAFVGQQIPSPINNTLKKKRETTTRIDGVTFKIPLNPEDEEEFVPEKSEIIGEPKKYSLRVYRKKSGNKKRTPAIANPRPAKSLTISSTKKTRTTKIPKARGRDSKERKLIVKLTLRGKVIKKIKKSKKSLLKRVKTSKGFFTNKYRFKLRWTPFEEYPQVDKQTYQEVFDLLAASLSQHGISLDRKGKDAEVVGAPQGPMHAGDAVTVDALVKVIMSQATNNENALSAQARLIKAFPYTVDEKTVVGKIPNYHDIRTSDPAKLKNALATAGLQNMRAKTIPECLNAIRQRNIDADSPGCTTDCNPPNAADFVPGSLSLEYLNKLSAQEKLDELVSLPGIGIKTACCILAFNFQLPVFAVDTHVFRMVKWLGWVPIGCNRDDASAHLDAFIPDELKYGLHQGFWHHGQKCLRCMAKSDPTKKGWEDVECVLEEYLKRHPKKERKSPSQKRKKADDDDNDGDDDGSDAPKPKPPKGNKTMTTKPMTAEQAEEDGYELHEIEINDNFNAPALGNVTHVKKVWVKKHVTKDG